MTLQETLDHFFGLYGRRNRVFLPGLKERIVYLNLGICDLQDAVRKEHNFQIIGVALARVGARIFCIAEHFWEIPFVESMSQKYPFGRCSYCQRCPCECPEKRPDAALETTSEEQLGWSIQQWQQHLNLLYGEKNRAKGIENLLNRLFKETGELLSLQMMIPNTDMSPIEVEKEFALELADALAWTIAIANFFGIGLEQALFERYGKDCWKCRQYPCVCTNFDVRPMKW